MCGTHATATRTRGTLLMMFDAITTSAKNTSSGQSTRRNASRGTRDRADSISAAAAHTAAPASDTPANASTANSTSAPTPLMLSSLSTAGFGGWRSTSGPCSLNSQHSSAAFGTYMLLTLPVGIV